jgi:hypothetical protein
VATNADANLVLANTALQREPSRKPGEFVGLALRQFLLAVRIAEWQRNVSCPHLIMGYASCRTLPGEPTAS